MKATLPVFFPDDEDRPFGWQDPRGVGRLRALDAGERAAQAAAERGAGADQRVPAGRGAGPGRVRAGVTPSSPDAPARSAGTRPPGPSTRRRARRTRAPRRSRRAPSGGPVVQPADHLDEAEVARRRSRRGGRGRAARGSRPSTARCRGSAAAGARPPRRAPEPRRGAHRGLEVGAPGGDLARDAAQRDRPLGREVERGQPRRRDARRPRPARGPSRSPVSAQRMPEHGDHPPLDRHRALELDQLLGDRGEQRLPRHAAGGARAGAGCARTALPITGSDWKRSWNGRRSSSTPVAKRIRAIPSAAAASVRARAANSTRSARRLHDADVHRARRRGAAAAAATRRAGASGRRPTRRRAGTATAARPRPGARPSGRSVTAALVAAQQVDVDQERVRGDDLAQPVLGLACACGAARGCGGGARRRPSRRRRRSRSPPARPPGGRARARAAPARPPRGPPGPAARRRPLSSWKSSGVSLTNATA